MSANQPRRLIALLGLALVGLAVASTASATAPGKNGRIAFRRYFDAQQTFGAVFTMAADGSQERQITRPPQGTVDDQPTWSSDGSLITFTRCPSTGGLCHVWTVRPDGSGIQPVGAVCRTGSHETTCPDDGGASFSPDSRKLAFVQSTGQVKPVPITGQQIQYSAIATMNLDGSGRGVIYKTKPFAADLAYPVYSPNGKQLVFERHNSGRSTPAGMHAIFVMNVDGSHLRRLTPWAENDGDNPDWSPDGRWILYHSHLDDPSRQAQYFVIHPDGTARTQITHFPSSTHVASAVFSPDGREIAISKGPEGGNIDVFTMRLDGTHIRRLTHSPLWDSAPAWGPA